MQLYVSNSGRRSTSGPDYVEIVRKCYCKKNLDVGEVLAVDVSCVAAVTSTVNSQIKYKGPQRRGDYLVTAILTGSGIAIIQSLPFQRFSRRIARAVGSPNMRENPKLLIQLDIFFFLGAPWYPHQY